MRLRELNASFLGDYRTEDGRVLYTRRDSIDGAQGILFDCPLGCGHAVLVWFTVPRIADPVPPSAEPGPARWQLVSGTSLDDLTLAPSIHLTGPGCGWHGFVKNGEAA